MTTKTEFHGQVETRFDDVKKEIDSRIIAKSRQLGGSLEAEMRAVLVAQNVMRETLEACLAKMTPFSTLTPQELAVRVASYCISALPDSEQESALYAVCTYLPKVHEQRMAQGVRLAAEWQSEP